MLDGRLDAAARATLQHHLHGCPDCTNELQQLARVSRAMHNLPPFRLADGMASRLRRQLATAPVASATPGQNAMRQRLDFWVSAAAAAILVFALGYWCGRKGAAPEERPAPAPDTAVESPPTIPPPRPVAPSHAVPEAAPAPNARFANFPGPVAPPERR
ncbi:MAG: zf-HC2 domain-containing protein [Planctomycetes bacterium]|nr:zf-HC2 domain-containing protein [Planctomycetota bacterium]